MKKRIIARIDVKNEYAIKGIHLEGLRKIGNPNELALKYYLNGIDEIIFMDAVASYYDRNSLSNIIEIATKNIYVPITVGGGIRSLEDIQIALNSGADKVSINTEAVKNPKFIYESAKKFGSQCIIGSIEAKITDNNEWKVFYDNGREKSDIDVISWAKKLQELGAGELLITSIDMEGTRRGFDVELSEKIAESVTIPVISSGGAGDTNHILNLFEKTNIDGVALASILHYNIFSVEEIKKTLKENKIPVRK
ncbi:MAG: imidazole glycerol phosphate synthase subunit HisF [Flavobacteriaceae bacterium]|nr:imidazole glycerol phosphate synthase subunit HisF [Flavobacteriaceae bacterium]|tara:strand:- start:12753 stop:13508 length:756 start_codon:yes stop_codon:yes gene_type:complete